MPGVIEESACGMGDVLVNLKLEQPRRCPTQLSTELLGLLEVEVGLVLPALLSLLQPPPPRPRLHMEVGCPGKSVGPRLFALPICQDPLPVGTSTMVAMPPSTLVEAVLLPLVTQGTEAAPLAEVRPLVAEDSGAAESDTPLDDSLSWVERVELEEAEDREFSPSPQPVENPEDGHALAAVLPCPPPVLRPLLQARDVVLAVRPIIFAGDAHQLVPSLVPSFLSQFSTDLTPEELTGREA